jgi:hypothetical protein
MSFIQSHTVAAKVEKKATQRRLAYSPHEQQAALFPLTENGYAVFRDPAFADNKNLPIHRWVPWIAGYSASFVDDAITTYLGNRKAALVLDPFCGVGTTLLQAVLRGHRAIGFEINPYPTLAARVKLSAPKINLAELDGKLVDMKAAAKGWRLTSAPADVVPPPLKSRLPFFSPKVERQVLHALAFMNGIGSEIIANLFRIAFGAVIVGISNYSYEPSLGSRPAAGKPLVEDADVAQVLLSKLQTMRADIAWMQKEMPGEYFGLGRVINGDFFSANEKLAEASIDLMVTSPPYMNNYHYVRNTRPQLYWLNFISSPGQQKHLETHNFGQYWQTVRDIEPINLAFEHPGLDKILLQLRKTRLDKGAYGGPGWANYVTAYFNDCYRFVSVLKRVLAYGGTGVIVVGNSIIQGIDIRIEQIIGEIGALQGLIVEGVHCVREKRVGASITKSSVRQGQKSRATLSEFAVILRKC